MRIATDIACIIALLLIPDCLIEKLGIKKTMETIINERRGTC